MMVAEASMMDRDLGTLGPGVTHSYNCNQLPQGHIQVRMCVEPT